MGAGPRPGPRVLPRGYVVRGGAWAPGGGHLDEDGHAGAAVRQGGGGRSAARRGRIDHAAGLYEEARERWTVYGHALERGQALFGSGRCLSRLERPGQAAPRLREARSAFAGLGAQPLVGETEAWLWRERDGA